MFLKIKYNSVSCYNAITRKIDFFDITVGKKMNYLQKGRKENRSEARSHTARPKRGDLACQ